MTKEYYAYTACILSTQYRIEIRIIGLNIKDH